MINDIFVHIPAYRDSELPKTLYSLINNCSDFNLINIGICHQYCHNDEYLRELEHFYQFNNIKFINIEYTQSNGLCWARNLINEKLYNNETYYLQLDSHHRFVKNWDIELQNMLNSLNDEMALLTGYPYSYDPDNDVDEYISDNNTLINVPIRFTNHDCHIIVKPEFEYNHTKPIKARCIAGGFIFTYGHFVKNCPHDPDIYFSEEIPMSIRAFTHGYNLYHPHRQFVFHEYIRKDKPKPWIDLNNNKFISRKRTEHLLFGLRKSIDLGQYGLGNKRTLKEYEDYSGIDFKNRIIHPYILKHIEPQCYIKQEYDEQEYEYILKIDNINQFLDNNYLKKVELSKLIIISQTDTVIYSKEIQNEIYYSHISFCFKSKEIPKHTYIIIYCENYEYYIFEYELIN